MLLIWLLLPAVSAIIDCKSACDLCQMDKDPATIYITCTLCRKCHWALNPRRMMELQMPDRNKLLVEGQVLTNKQLKELKNAELKEFKDVLKDYGWKPEDLVDKRVNDHDEECLPPTDNCLVEWESEEHHRLPLKGTTKPKCPGLHHTTCPPDIATTRKCPPIKPCKKKHTERTTEKLPPNETTEPDSIIDPKSTSPSPTPGPSALRKLRKRIMRQLANLDNADDQDDGCPVQPDCSDEESDDDTYEKLVNKHRIITPPPLTMRTTSTTERPCPDKLKGKTSTSAPCVPCMPQCPLPCIPPLPMPMPMPLPAPVAIPAPMGLPPPLGLPAFLPSQIPIEAMEALMTLKTMTQKQADIETTTKKHKQEKKIKEKEEKQISASSIQSSEDEMVLKETSTKATTEDEFLYLYVGIPDNVKSVRKG